MAEVECKDIIYIIVANTLACEILKVIGCYHVIHKSYMTNKERKAYVESKINTSDFQKFFYFDLNKLVKRRGGMGEKNIYVTPSFLNNISQEIAYTD